MCTQNLHPLPTTSVTTHTYTLSQVKPTNSQQCTVPTWVLRLFAVHLWEARNRGHHHVCCTALQYMSSDSRHASTCHIQEYVCRSQYLHITQSMYCAINCKYHHVIHHDMDRPSKSVLQCRHSPSPPPPHARHHCPPTKPSRRWTRTCIRRTHVLRDVGSMEDM